MEKFVIRHTYPNGERLQTAGGDGIMTSGIFPKIKIFTRRFDAETVKAACEANPSNAGHTFEVLPYSG
jgi:hypothetical protein